MNEIRSLLQAALDHPAFRAARQALARGGKQASLSGLTRPAQALVVAALERELSRPLLVVTSDNEAADRLRQTAATFLAWLGGPPEAAATLPAFDCLPYDQRSPHPEISERRAVALWNLAQGRTCLLFFPLVAALGRFREKSFYGSLALELKPGEEVGRDDLVEHLERVGYEPGEPVASLGQYSLRGGIVDVFPPESEWPYRIEFFGDRIESLREFDPATQRSRRPAAHTRLLPLTEFPRSPRFSRELTAALIEREAKLGGRLARLGREPDWAPEYSALFPGWEFFAPLAQPHGHALPSLVESPLVVWDDFKERERQLRQTLEGWRARYEEVSDVIPHRPRPDELLLSAEEFLGAFQAAPQVFLQELAATSGEPELPTRPAPKFRGAVKALAEDARARLQKRERVVFVLPTSGKMDRLREILREYEIPYQSAGTVPPASGPAEPASGAALLVPGELEEGVDFADLHLVLLTDRDLFGEFVWGTPKRRERSALSSFLSDLSDLKVGDYVVHVDHGVGIYRGLRKVEVSGAERDFMLLTYQNDARLYVPLERLDLVEKYRAGGDGAVPALDRLGGARWARTKSRLRRALRDMAGELLHLYAERKMRGGVAYSPDTPWQKEFEETFEFEETPDQLNALAEIKRDLEQPQPMDRLLCGDVGYGKTELAMRAAFKVAQDGRQVAVLAPTTVLAFQHFSTFRQRLAPFPVRVEMLSRFRSAAEQKKIMTETEAGRVDILVGTHRLLSRDVRFRELGLLIVDEEQRFGVAAKEKLKKLRVGVDVLTLSATPIPRTLHMTVGGLRDLSVIETPPRGRLAIQTVVAPFSDGLLQSAILQELGRQGQVFFVHNRVESIFSMAAHVQRLVPTARLGVAHGQMSEKELERAMLKFIQGEYDVLVSTALIENGLDIPRANTMIINRAHRFGLADLYQLRGRVGRSNRRAYAYLLISAEDSLTPTAQRRLAALKEFSDLGAGFRLAALDLELRGAGNLLGAEQSGHLNAVGLDLYLQMLAETVDELKGLPARPQVRTTLNLGLDIKIPDPYIADESQRLRLYKRISSLASPEARSDLEAELVDRYGPPPPSVVNLLAYAQLKSLAENLLVESVERKAEEVWVRFHEQAPVSPDRLKAFVRGRRGAQFRPDGTLRFRLAAPDSALPAAIANALRELRPSP